MRKHLIEMIRQHLGDFHFVYFRTIQPNTNVPLPGLLTNVWKRYSATTTTTFFTIFATKIALLIAEPVELFRACLERFKQQVDLVTKQRKIP
jgi:hypothetical protein